MVDHPTRQRLRASTAFALLATVFALFFGVVVALLAHNQQQVLASAEHLQQTTVPEIIRHQRLARNLDQLRHEGESVFSASSNEARQQALFVVMLIASHPSILDYAPAAELTRDSERFLIETGRLASEDPRQLALRHKEWQRLSTRLSLAVDDLLTRGASQATNDLAEMSATMQLAHYKLLGALALVSGFLLLLLLLLKRHLIRPLQQIDRSLSSLSVDSPAPEFPDGQLAEIHAVEEATRRLHASLVSNDAARRELEQLANRDGLTGLMNRRHFLASASAELRRAQRYQHPVAVALGDLDFFKRLNDTYGHGAGDQVLRTFAGFLGDSVRHSDLVCRYGGEEFAFLFPESTVEQAHVLLERFRQRLSELDIRLPDGLLVRITLSIGLADASHLPIETALQHADFALYEAKRLGRNRIIVSSAANGTGACTS